MDQSKIIKKELLDSIDQQNDTNMEIVKNLIEISENKLKSTNKIKRK